MGFRFQDFPIYREVRAFVKEIYLLAEKLPKEEKFGLISQIKSANPKYFVERRRHF